MEKRAKNIATNKKILKIAGLIALGIVLGAAFTSSPEPKVETKTETVEKVVTVEKTPQSCVEALRIYNISISKIGNGLSGIQNGDNTAAFDAANYMKENTDVLAVANGDCISKQ